MERSNWTAWTAAVAFLRAAHCLASSAICKLMAYVAKSFAFAFALSLSLALALLRMTEEEDGVGVDAGEVPAGSELEEEPAPAKEAAAAAAPPAPAASDCTRAFRLLFLSPPESREPSEASESTAASLLVGRKRSLEGDLDCDCDWCTRTVGLGNAVHIVVVIVVVVVVVVVLEGVPKNVVARRRRTQHSMCQAAVRTRGRGS
jgi:hypothetical protein